MLVVTAKETKVKMYINGKRTETVGVSEGLDVGEEVGCKQATYGYMLGALI